MGAPSCALCSKLATVRAWVIVPRWTRAAGEEMLRDRAAKLDLCADCRDEVAKAGNLIDGAPTEVL